MAKTYTFHPPGYNPTEDQKPPRAKGLAPILGCFGLIVLLACGVGFVLSLKMNYDKAAAATRAAAIPTSTLTLDAWSATGTMLYWEPLTPSPTLSATPTETQTPTST